MEGNEEKTVNDFFLSLTESSSRTEKERREREKKERERRNDTQIK